MELSTVRMELPDGTNLIVGQSHFIANPVEIVVARSDQGRGVLGVIDGSAPKGVETLADVVARKELLRKFGYKL